MSWKEVIKEIEMKEEQKEELLRKCLERKHTNNAWMRYSKAAAVLLTILIGSMGGVTVYAAVNAYQARLEAMDEKKVEEYYEMGQSGTGEADGYSRNMSDTEKERLEELRIAFREGQRFPEGEIKTEKQESGFYYDIQNRTFYLPERELTDEELLQILDMWAKEDYSLQKKNAEEGITAVDEEEARRALMEEYEKNKVEWSEEDVVYARAVQVIEESFGVDTKGMETEITYWESDSVPGSEGTYRIKMLDGERKFFIGFRVYSGEISKIPDNIIGSLHTEENAVSSVYPVSEMTEEKIERIYTEAKRIAEVMEIGEIISGHCYYNYSENEEEIFNSVSVLFETENKERYDLIFSPETEKMVMERTYEYEPYGDIDMIGGQDVVIQMD